MIELSQDQKLQIISILQKINVVRYGEFILKNGSESSVYIDLRILPNFPNEYEEVIKIISDFFLTQEWRTEFDGIISPPLAGIPLGLALAIKLKKEFYLARLVPKAYGTQKIIEGNISGKRILVVDDVITSGGSKLPIISAIRDHGALITSLFVFINRMKSPDLKNFENENDLRVSYLFSLEEISTFSS
ncbi:MAG: hypothetical protein JSV04_08745 [Candidatus Heimdallarchaeota archaeon]|nr:MAG: hypothetical protein JSV04_08745 [Candidatus Heimdallarchaeota archaeon]